VGFQYSIADGADQTLDISKTNNALKLAWDGFKLLSKKIEPLLGGTPFKTPIAVLNVLIELGEVRESPCLPV
jgi:hypothetical protein